MTTVRGAVKKKEFSLGDYKKTKGIDKTMRNKPDRWIPASKAFKEITGLPGAIYMSGSHFIFGYENSGKTTLILEAAISAQKMNILPVFLMTEQKHKWDHAKTMGFEVNEIVDADGVVSYDGFFLYYDRHNFSTVEELAKVIHGLIDDQEAGKLPYDLLFLIDSFGKLNCDKGVKNKNQFNPQWISSSIAHEFGASVIPRINMSISEKSQYTNTLVQIIQPWTELPDVYGALPKLTPKGGKSLPQDSSIGYKFGSNTNSGTSSMKLKKKGREIVWGTRTKVEVVKNHITMLSTKGKLIATPHGFILEDEEKEYLAKHAEYFLAQLNTDSFDDVEFFEEDNSDDEPTTIEDILD
jgi:hypothetical protein